MIAHIRVPHFLAHVMQEENDSSLIVHDSSRILDVSPEAEEEGLESGLFLNTVELDEAINQVEFSLGSVEEAQEDLRIQIQKLSPVAETLELGEFLVDIDDRQHFESWFNENHGNPYPLTAAVASTGWLARVLSLRECSGDWAWVDESGYRERLKQVEVSEFWGFGPELMNTLNDVDLRWMSEILHLDETDLRQLAGVSSRIFDKLDNGLDPRPMNVFSRPRSLSVELEPSSSDSLYQQGKGVLGQFQQQLQSSASLAYRLSLVLYDDRENRRRSHELTTPTDEVEILNVAWNRMSDGVEPENKAKISLDMIVGDVENYHRDPQEDATDIEILS